MGFWQGTGVQASVHVEAPGEGEDLVFGWDFRGFKWDFDGILWDLNEILMGFRGVLWAFHGIKGHINVDRTLVIKRGNWKSSFYWGFNTVGKMIYTANDKSLPFDYRRVMGFDVFFLLGYWWNMGQGLTTVGFHGIIMDYHGFSWG
jgi:hypothetical protein